MWGCGSLAGSELCKEEIFVLALSSSAEVCTAKPPQAITPNLLGRLSQENKKIVGEDVETLEALFTVGRNAKTVQPLWKTEWKFLKHKN